jgi:hypothetical protein
MKNEVGKINLRASLYLTIELRRHHGGQQYYVAAPAWVRHCFPKSGACDIYQNEFSRTEYAQLHCKKAV